MTTVTRVLKIKLTMMAMPKADNGSTIFSLLFKKIPNPVPFNQACDVSGCMSVISVMTDITDQKGCIVKPCITLRFSA
jgi:hypothetical protein